MFGSHKYTRATNKSEPPRYAVRCRSIPFMTEAKKFSSRLVFSYFFCIFVIDISFLNQ